MITKPQIFNIWKVISALCSIMTPASAEQYGNYTYTVNGSSITITRYAITAGGAIAIPSAIDGTPVTSIGTGAFTDCTSLTSVTIPNSVTSIGPWAFVRCTNVIRMTIPHNVTSIGDGAFSHCSSLTGVTIPNSVTSIAPYAFEFCTSLTSLTIPSSVTNIGHSAFKYCTSLPSITIPDSVTSIGLWAFWCCTKLTSVTIPYNVTTIGVGTFNNCTSLTSVTIPNRVTLIEQLAFSDCTSLTSVTIGNSVTRIDYAAFRRCTNLTSVTIPNSVTRLEFHAFESCTNLASVIIGNGVTSIMKYVFSGCSSLSGITIPDSVTSIEDFAFNTCTSLASVIIGNGVASIGTDAFKSCTGLTHVTIGNSVTSLDYWAFTECPNLASVTIGYSVTSIGASTFKSCTNLASVTIGSSVTSIGDSAFQSCTSLASVTIPDSVTRIGDSAFESCGNLASVTIGKSVTRIGNAAFESCTHLSSVMIGNSVTIIGLFAFESCTSLTSVTIPDSVTQIGGWAFNGCTLLSSVTIGNGVTSIDEGAFESCDSLTSIDIGNSVTNIGTNAFNNCLLLTSVTIPAHVTSIGNHAFFFCVSLKSAEFIGYAPSMGASVFDLTDTDFTVYYDDFDHGSTGFTSPTWKGYPAVNLANTPPTISDVSDLSLNDTDTPANLSFTVDDAETEASLLTVSCDSSNHTVIPLANIRLDGSGANRGVTITPVAGHAGSSTITLTVSDGGLTASHTFIVTVTTEKEIPVITWADPKAIPYGTPLSADQLNAKANVPGTWIYDPPIGTKFGAGTHTETVIFTPSDPNQYATIQKSVPVFVIKVAVKVTLNSNSLKQTYNGQPRAVTATTVPAGFHVNMKYSSTTYPASATPPVNAGSYTVTATINDPNASGIATGTLAVAKGKATITFPIPPPLRNGDPDYTLQASVSSGMAVSYASSPPTVATIVNGNKLHLLNAGKVTVTATAPATLNWEAATAKISLTIGKRIQNINFPALTGHAMGDVDFFPGATATSGLAVSYATASPKVATIVKGKIHIVGAGTAVITASQAGDATWDKAAPVPQTLTVAIGTQMINFPAIPAKEYGSADFAPVANVVTGLTGLTYISSNPLVATIVSGKIHLTGVGVCIITAKQAGNVNWSPATASKLLTVVQGTPVFTWAVPKAITYGTTLTATQLNAKANVPGSFVYAPALGTKLDAGIQPLKATFTPTDAARYKSVEKVVSLTVNAAKAAALAKTVSSSLGFVAEGTGQNARATGGAGILPAAFLIPVAALSKLPVLAAPVALTTMAVPTDVQEIRAFYAEMKRRIEAREQSGFFALFAPDYLHHGQDLSDCFDQAPGLFDAVKDFTFDLAGITVTGVAADPAGRNACLTTGVATFTFTDGRANETWTEPDLTNNAPGIGWLEKAPDGWRVIGDQKHAKVAALTIRDATPGNDSHTLQFTADSALEITGVTVSGPGIPDTVLVPDADQQGGWSASVDALTDPVPAARSNYVFTIDFADGTRESDQDTLQAWVPTLPDL